MALRTLNKFAQKSVDAFIPCTAISLLTGLASGIYLGRSGTALAFLSASAVLGLSGYLFYLSAKGILGDRGQSHIDDDEFDYNDYRDASDKGEKRRRKASKRNRHPEPISRSNGPIERSSKPKKAFPIALPAPVAIPKNAKRLELRANNKDKGWPNYHAIVINVLDSNSVLVALYKEGTPKDKQLSMAWIILEYPSKQFAMIQNWKAPQWPQILDGNLLKITGTEKCPAAPGGKVLILEIA